jgi:hypothetical protein
MHVAIRTALIAVALTAPAAAHADVPVVSDAIAATVLNNCMGGDIAVEAIKTRATASGWANFWNTPAPGTSVASPWQSTRAVDGHQVAMAIQSQTLNAGAKPIKWTVCFVHSPEGSADSVASTVSMAYGPSMPNPVKSLPGRVNWAYRVHDGKSTPIPTDGLGSANAIAASAAQSLEGKDYIVVVSVSSQGGEAVAAVETYTTAIEPSANPGAK